MKTCSRCGETKDLSEFTKRRSSRDGLNAACKACTRSVVSKHYQENKGYYKGKSKNHNEKIVRYIRNVKENGSCVRCGIIGWWRLEFHHRNPNEKDHHVSKMIGKSLKSVKEEISKCDIVCANCHRDIHYETQL